MHHVLEPGGRGGVYQHTLSHALGEARSGRPVVVHTARDNELKVQHANIEYCPCMRWQRRGPSFVRRVVSLSWLMLVVLPHLFRVARPADSWEVQGSFGNGAYLLCIAVLRLRRVKPLFAPHNDFSRSGSRLQEHVRRLAEHLAAGVVVFHDKARGGRPSNVPVIRRSLTQYVPSDWPDHVPYWRSRWGSAPVLLFAGQLRDDKDPVTLVKAASLLEHSHVLAFVGEDLGAREDIERAAKEAGIDVDIVSDYLPLAKFAAAISLARVVVCPYLVASQSGVLALAASLGTSTLASRVGGLAAQADETFEPRDVQDLGAKLARLLA